MPKVARKIRKIVRSSESASKYILYASGEIALVVFGILIALQINNWNEKRKMESTINGHLKSLSKAIQQDVRELTISLEFSEAKTYFLQYLLRHSDIPFEPLTGIPRPDTFIEEHWIGPYPDTLESNFIKSSLPQFSNAFLGMVFNYSAINEINNLGVLSEIQEDSLKTMITDYYYFLDWRFGEQSVNWRYKVAEDLKNHLRDKYGFSIIYPPDSNQIIGIIKEDPKLVVMLKELAKVSFYHYWATWDLREKAIKLVDLLDACSSH